MLQPSYFLLYVDNPLASATFYTKLFGREPVEAGPTFALFVLDSGIKIGLWSKHTVQPVATLVGGSEMSFSVADNTIVNDTYADWVERGLPIAQKPVAMDFGYTFVALDPDGHRLRVFALSAE